jgi:hypothetical protein
MYPFIQNIRSTYDYVYFYFYFWRVFKLSILSPVAFEFFKFSTIIHLRSSVVWCGLVWSRLVWSCPVGFGPVFSGSIRFCPVRSGPVQSGPFRSGLVRSLVRLGSVFSPVSPGPVWSGLVQSTPVVFLFLALLVKYAPVCLGLVCHGQVVTGNVQSRLMSFSLAVL